MAASAPTPAHFLFSSSDAASVTGHEMESPSPSASAAAGSARSASGRVFRHRKKRRKAVDIAPAELWHCSFAPCDKIYKRTSSVSINKHKLTCEHRPDELTGLTPLQHAAAAAVCLPQQPQLVQQARQLLPTPDEAAAMMEDEEALSLPGSPLSPSSPCHVVELERVLAGALSKSMIAHIAALAPSFSRSSSSALPDHAVPDAGKRRRSVSSACSSTGSSVASARSASSRQDSLFTAAASKLRRSHPPTLGQLRQPLSRFTTAPPPASLEACISQTQHHQRPLSSSSLASLICMPPPALPSPFTFSHCSPTSPLSLPPPHPFFTLPEQQLS